MSVVISELVVLARVGASKPAERERTEAERQQERGRLVEDTVAEVMRILRRKEEP